MADREVIVGVLESECRWLIRTVITAHTKHRPYITLKWAESTDGFIDKIRTGGTAAKLSSNLSTMLVHKRRCETDGILVGTRTAQLDNPSLTVRNWYGKNPTRIVIDKDLKVDKNSSLYNNEAATLIFTAQTEITKSFDTNFFTTIDFNKNIIPGLLRTLYGENIHSLMVEGGSALLQSFIDEQCWDEAFVERAPIKLDDGVKAPQITNYTSVNTERHFGSEIIHYMR